MNPRLLILAACLLASTAFAQTFSRPKSVLGMKWGASRIEVLTALGEAGATIPETLFDSTEPRIQATGGKFAGQEVVMWDVELVNGKLVALSATMKAADSGSALFREIKKELAKKYGPPTGERRLSTLTPDQKRALQVAGARVPNQGTATSWKFPANLQEKESLTLSCEMAPPTSVATEDESQFLVTVRYASESLRAQLDAITNPDPGATPKSGRPLRGKDL
ncbi:MAG: hypothetical protein ABMA13_17055 [Chthoniobacteraceae bacterium]